MDLLVVLAAIVLAAGAIVAAVRRAWVPAAALCSCALVLLPIAEALGITSLDHP